MSALSLEATVVASRDQVAADLESEVIILGLTDGVYYGVDGVAARIWSMVQQPVRLQEIVRAVHAEFDVEEAACQADVLAFVGELARRGLVTRVGDGA